MTTESILLADGDPTFLRVVRRALEVAGYDVEAADSVEAILQKTAETPPAVVVIDAEMDGSPGLIRYLASSQPQTECILLTTDPDVSALVELYDSGNIYNHRWKPLDDIGDLARDIARALERRTLKRQNAYLLTELRDARDALRSQAEFLAQVEALAAIGQMTVDLAKGMEAPLTGLIGYAEYLARALAARPAHAWTEEQREQMIGYAREMAQAAGQCQSLARGLRDLRDGSSRAMEPLDLRPLIRETLGLLRHSLEARGVQLKSDIAPELPPLRANAALMQQALTHLVLNALQAMPDGGALYLTVEALPGHPGGVRLTLHDTGIGIDTETLPRIFEPFFTTRPPGQGTGLGLAIVRTIVREHGGDIQVDTAPGRGTTFILTFPALSALAPEDSSGVLRAA